METIVKVQAQGGTAVEVGGENEEGTVYLEVIDSDETRTACATLNYEQAEIVRDLLQRFINSKPYPQPMYSSVGVAPLQRY